MFKRSLGLGINQRAQIGTLLNQKWLAYKQRVLTDLGLIRDESLTKKYFDLLKNNNIPEPVVCLIAEAGVKPRVVTAIQQFATKVYSLFGTNDATQTTAASQPYLKVPAAPNERASFQNPNGDSRFMTHPTVSFGSGDAWTVSWVGNWLGSANAEVSLLGKGSDTLSNIKLRTGSVNRFSITNESGTTVSGAVNLTSTLIGKFVKLSFVADGLGSLKIYSGSTLIETLTITTNFVFTNLVKGSASVSRDYNGLIGKYAVTNAALTPAQIALTSNFWSTYYPEIPTVTIDSQQWATSNFKAVGTPQGNLIANVTENVNVEKIANIADREFSSDTGFWTKDAGITIGGGTLVFTNVADANGFQRSSIVSANKWHKIIYTISDYISGGIAIRFPFNSVTRNANGTYTEYIYSNDATGSTAFRIKATSANTTLKIDNISIQEIGWAGSTELYDGIYAQTVGTVEQKTYAAVKASAMWSYYNNDSAIGAWAGKLYNWYAVKLLQMDIDYYNAANPTTPWGYRVPTDTDFNTLATTLGGASVAGGKMKKEGLNYWNSPNTGADNSSGFSALGGGFRNGVVGLGTFSSKDLYFIAWSIIEGIVGEAYRLRVDYNATSVVIDDINKATGYQIRLIKS